MEKISIIVPVYNCEKQTERCIASLLSQTYANIEIIAVDDGSDDRSGEILDRLAHADERLSVTHTENKGVTSARELGISKACGEYMCFCDSDDYFDADMCETLLTQLRKHNADIAVCGYKKQYVNGETRLLSTPDDDRVFDNTEAMWELINAKHFTGSLCTKLFKSSLIKNIKTDKSLKYNEDVLLCYYAFKNADIVTYTNKCKYNYCVNPSSATMSGSRLKMHTDMVAVAKLMYEELKGTPNENCAARRYISILAYLYREYYADRKYKDDKKRTKLLIKSLYKRYKRYLDRHQKVNVWIIKYASALYPASLELYNKVRRTPPNIDF